MATHKQSFLRKVGLPADSTLSIQEISEYSGMPIQALKEVWEKGMGAYYNNLSSVRLQGSFKKNPNVRRYPASARLSPHQWALARIYAFVDKSPKVFYGADRHIAERYNLL